MEADSWPWLQHQIWFWDNQVSRSSEGSTHVTRCEGLPRTYKNRSGRGSPSHALCVFRFNSKCVFLCFLFFFFFSCSFFFQLKLNAIEFWTKSTLITSLVLNSIYSMFDVSFLLPLFPFLVPSFLLLFFSFPFCSTVPLSFPFLIVKVFQFSDNLSDNLAITFCWKGTPEEG